MSTRGVLRYLITVLFVSPLLLALPQAGPASALDWSVTGLEERSNETLHLESNLTIKAGGKLALYNVTLLVNCSLPGEYIVTVETGGELSLRNCTVASNGLEPYLLRACAGSKLTVSGSKLSGAGLCATEPSLSGFLVQTTQCTLENSTFTQNAPGVCIDSASVRFSDCMFISNVAGLLQNSSNVSLDRCTFAQNKVSDIVLRNASRAECLDSYMAQDRVAPEDPGSVLNLSWSLDVEVRWDDGTPAGFALVNITPSDGVPVLHQASSTGTVQSVPVLARTIDMGSKRYHGPFDISAEASGRNASVRRDISDISSVLLILDGTPPVITINHPNIEVPENSTNITVRGSALDPVGYRYSPGISVVEVRLDGGNWTAANGTGEWTCNFTGVSEGAHVVAARAFDTSGNWNQSSTAFTVDLRPPLLEFWPSSGYATSARNITVRIISDGIRLSFGGKVVWSFVPGAPTNVTWALDAEGDNTVGMEAWDPAGNRAFAELNVVRDTTSPVTTIFAPVAYSHLSSTAITLTGESRDDSGISVVKASIDRNTWTRCIGNASWTVTISGAEGPNTIYICATDILGNSEMVWTTVFVELPDTNHPWLEVTAPMSGHVTEHKSIPVTGRAGDDGEVRNVEFSLDNRTWTAASGTLYWTFEVALEYGPNTIYIRATDIAGNSALSTVSVTFTPPQPDRTAPNLTIGYPPSGLNVKEGKLLVSGTVSDPGGISGVEVSVGGKNWTKCIVTGTDWSTIVTLTAGNNSIFVRAYDTEGNIANAATSATMEKVKRTAPDRGIMLPLVIGLLVGATAVWIGVRAYLGRKRSEEMVRLKSTERNERKRDTPRRKRR